MPNGNGSASTERHSGMASAKRQHKRRAAAAWQAPSGGSTARLGNSASTSSGSGSASTKRKRQCKRRTGTAAADAGTEWTRDETHAKLP